MKIPFLHLTILLLIGFSGITQTNMAVALDNSAKAKTTNTKDMVHFLSFNIRYGTAQDGANVWPLRREMVSDLIRQQMPDFLGTQETQAHQSEYLQKKLPEYSVLQRARDAKPSAGSEMCPLFYRKDRWTLDPKDHGTFWLSETPNKPGSKDPKAALPRIVTWGRFSEKETGRSVYVYNVHFSHRSPEAREKAAMLIANKMAARKDSKAPAVLMGDFNAGETSKPIRFLLGKIADAPSPLQLVDPFRILHPEEKTIGTFNGFEFGNINGKKIDYTLTTPDLKPLETEILRDSEKKRYPSDHFPVMLKAQFP